jgi:chromosome segregation ATPase
MENEKYINYYIEAMTGTMTDAVIRNISLQANARVTNEVIEEQKNLIQELSQQVENLSTELKIASEHKQNSENSTINDLNSKIQAHLETINSLNHQIGETNKMKAEYENVKHQVQHVDTFRNELLKERDEHQKTRDSYESRIGKINADFESKLAELNDRIEYLQLTPAKRKKIDDAKANTTVTTVDVTSMLVDSATKDGGSF